MTNDELARLPPAIAADYIEERDGPGDDWRSLLLRLRARRLMAVVNMDRSGPSAMLCTGRGFAPGVVWVHRYICTEDGGQTYVGTVKRTAKLWWVWYGRLKCWRKAKAPPDAARVLAAVRDALGRTK